MKILVKNSRMVTSATERPRTTLCLSNADNKIREDYYTRTLYYYTSTAGDMPSAHGKLVCVTGAGGFIASWLVKLLLEKGYTVRGTVRDPEDPKNAHLRGLEGAERLTLCKADLNDYDSLKAAIHGCDGVFHIASPVSEDPKMLEPAVNGAKYVIKAAAAVASSTCRVVLTSSIGTVHMDDELSLNLNHQEL